MWIHLQFAWRLVVEACVVVELSADTEHIIFPELVEGIFLQQKKQFGINIRFKLNNSWTPCFRQMNDSMCVSVDACFTCLWLCSAVVHHSHSRILSRSGVLRLLSGWSELLKISSDQTENTQTSRSDHPETIESSGQKWRMRCVLDVFTVTGCDLILKGSFP